MIKPGALILAVVMAGVTTGTYYGLDFLPPGAIPPPIGRNPPDTGVPPPGAEPSQVASAAPAQPAAAPAAPAEQPQQPAPTEQDLAEEPAPAPAPSQPAPQPEPTPQAAAPAPAPEPKKEAKAAPAPSAQLSSEPSEAAPEAAATKPKAAPKPKPATEPTQTASAAPAEAPKTKAAPQPDADVIKPWWPDASKLPANQLKLMYAGQVQGEEAVALLFSSSLNIDTVKQHAQIKDINGGAVTGDWELGKNPRLAVFRGVKPGRYTIVLAPEIADAKGFMLGQTLKGPVYVKEPLKINTDAQ